MSSRSCLLVARQGATAGGGSRCCRQLSELSSLKTTTSRTASGASPTISASSPVARRGLLSITRMTGGANNVVRSRDASSGQHQRVLTEDNVYENLVKMEYAVRGPLLIRAIEIEKELTKGAKKPFKEVLKANIGDAHAMGQQPITFLRQVLALAIYPKLLDDPSFPEDAKERTRTILDGCKGSSIGSYSESSGIEIIRKHAAKYIEERDGGIPSNPNHIMLSNGASDAIKSFLKLFNERINGKPTGVMIPIPQYPLYSAALAEFGLHQAGYYLNEDNKWSLDVSELENTYSEAQQHSNPRVLVVINPGNPTGQVLSRENIEDIIRFAYKKRLFLLADEVYQDNIYHKDCCFHSFKKVMNEMGEPFSKMELASFMSISKGYMGECGLRGGYGEIVNMDPKVFAILMKSISAMLCPTTVGQAAMDVVVNPPRRGEPSYEQFLKEKEETLKSLAERSRLVVDTLNSIPGFFANPAMGAMYVFPRIDLPEKAIKAAKAAGQHPDVFYAFKLLESTGICVIPGSGFGQRPGTYHFRTTILPQKDKIKTMLGSLKEFHEKFIKEYS
ncbi:alanine aminotransferase 2 [Copidosoma floridanum]|uniref:alanine aminotransferase 2 n=1 Tax=Copidosoma floridanum TaxID=29053 RepID=UPI0006C95CB3|nr:alanine aminotransferase 2 [Copidosoma floridanum]XP_014206239.1 alanine aminotransferase 2 [Copidosoma floridanum]